MRLVLSVYVVSVVGVTKRTTYSVDLQLNAYTPEGRPKLVGRRHTASVVLVPTAGKSGARYDLPHPFHVLATQNPLEQEGTYPLPEAQLDRFLMQIDVGYPDLEAEKRVLIATTGVQDEQPKEVLRAQDIMFYQKLVRAVPVGEKVLDAILALVRSARPEAGGAEDIRAHVAWGPGPRASQALTLCARARALYDGRLAPSIDDVHALAEPVLQHRMALSYAARAEGMTVRDVIARLVKKAG